MVGSPKRLNSQEAVSIEAASLFLFLFLFFIRGIWEMKCLNIQKTPKTVIIIVTKWIRKGQDNVRN
jgi:hypothetical protein